MTMQSEEFEGRSAQMRTSPWLASEDLIGLGDVKVTIDRVFFHKAAEFEAGRKEDVYALKFEKGSKQLILNATNRKRLVALFGAKVVEWQGKEISLYVDPNVKMRGKTVPGIRIR